MVYFWFPFSSLFLSVVVSDFFQNDEREFCLFRVWELWGRVCLLQNPGAACRAERGRPKARLTHNIRALKISLHEVKTAALDRCLREREFLRPPRYGGRPNGLTQREHVCVLCI